MNILSVLNHPFPGAPDPQSTRIVIVLFVMAVAFRWAQQMRQNWVSWTRRERRDRAWVTALLITNAALLLAAAQRDDPILVGTALLGAVFVGMTASTYLIFPNDDSTEPVYDFLHRYADCSRRY